LKTFLFLLLPVVDGSQSYKFLSYISSKGICIYLYICFLIVYWW